ncbi:MAG: primosomal protein N' (replication factor Y) - superfamily II helicase, partial [Paracoccaceae bacterium]
CGSDFRFDPDTSALICDHCGAVGQMPDDANGPWGASDHSALQEHDLRGALARQATAHEVEETRVSVCPSCAAQVSLGADTHATECPYCATPVVADTGVHRHIKPQALAPFVIDEDAAQDAMVRWLKGLWFAPGGLQAYARKGGRMQGIYAPYWTYDAATQTHYRGARGRVYQVTTRGPEGKPRSATRTDWTPVSGHVARRFDDVLVLGSTALPKRYTDALQPWNLGALTRYQPAYLAGFRAEGYTVDVGAGYDDARAQMDRTIRRDVEAQIGGDRQRITALNTQVADVTFKHILLPVWVAAYHYRGKTYRFVVNGQSGRVRGERPWSVLKIAGAVVLGLAVAAAIALVMPEGA